MQNDKLKDLKFYPTVYAVGKKYQIVVYSDYEMLVGIKAGGRIFYDNSNGVKRSLEKVHKITVPSEIIDSAEKYSVCYTRVIERKGDYTQTQDEVTIEFAFKPIKNNGDIKVYQVADAHQKEIFPEKSARYFGDDTDLLVINGDTFDYLNSPEDFEYLLRMTSEIAHGRIPVVFAKGNHDNKGKYAEKLCDYVGTDCGRSYFTFRLGSLWGMVLDCGENCADETDFYGKTVCHHAFREEQTDFIRSVISRAEKEYLEPGVKTRLIVSHCAFNNVRVKPFDIERGIYEEWTKLINDYIKPDLMISAHLHIARCCLPDSDLNTLGLKVPFVIGSDPVGWQTGKITDFIGLALTISDKNVTVEFTDSALKCLERHVLPKRRF